MAANPPAVAPPPSPLTIHPSTFTRGQNEFTLTLPPLHFVPNGTDPSMAVIPPAQILTHLFNDVLSILEKLHHCDDNHSPPPLYDLMPSPSEAPRINKNGELEMRFRVDRNQAAADADWLFNANSNFNLNLIAGTGEVARRLVGMDVPISWSGWGRDGDVAVWLGELTRRQVMAVEFQLAVRHVAVFRQLVPW